MATLLARLKQIIRDGKFISVVSDELDNDSVKTINIKNESVTTEKLADKSVDANKLADESVTTEKLGIPDEDTLIFNCGESRGPIVLDPSHTEEETPIIIGSVGTAPMKEGDYLKKGTMYIEYSE